MKVVSSLIRDRIELTDAAGEVIKAIPFTINATKIANEVTERRLAITKAKDAGDAEVGKAVLDLYVSLFGEETTKELLDYYQDDYLTLMADTLPIVTQRILPVFDSMRKRIIEQKKLMKHA